MSAVSVSQSVLNAFSGKGGCLVQGEEHLTQKC